MTDDSIWTLIKVAGHWPGKTSIAPRVTTEVHPVMERCRSHLEVVKENVRTENYGVAAEYANLANRRLQEAKRIEGWDDTEYWTHIYDGGAPVYSGSSASNAVDALTQLNAELEALAQAQESQ